MSTDARQGWNAAKLASQRPLPKPRVMHGPVGRQIDASRNCMTDEEINRPTDARIWFAMGECSCCRNCGYHVCSCPPHPDDSGYSPSTQAYLKAARKQVAEMFASVGGMNSVARGASCSHELQGVPCRCGTSSAP